MYGLKVLNLLAYKTMRNKPLPSLNICQHNHPGLPTCTKFSCQVIPCAAEFLEAIRCRQLFLHVTSILGICEGFIEVDLVVRGTDLLGFD